MKLVLTGLRRIEALPSSPPSPMPGMTRLTVRYCGVCRTDAKMWNEGHRDLVFPRVPGHELIAVDDGGRPFTVWPGRACGRCHYCTTGRENLCDAMQIMGFHFDGGFSSDLLAPTDSLIPVPQTLSPHLACFAEPVGCVLNALEKLDLGTGRRLIVYGGGTIGLLTALVAGEQGATPLVIEKNAEKINQAAPFLESCRIDCRRETTASEFDAVVNACPDPIAFNLGITKLAKGGRVAFFSGLGKNQQVETNLLNLLHYREAALFGAYGLCRRHMTAALDIIHRHQAAIAHLIEAIVRPAALDDQLPGILAGRKLKVILDFTGRAPALTRSADPSQNETARHAETAQATADAGLFQHIRDAIRQVETDILPAAQHKMDNKTKPLGALGRLETLAIQISQIQRSLSPRVDHKALFVFAADHGITEEGVSAYPSSVTAQMVDNFLAGGAAINVLCRHHGIPIKIVDMGVAADIAPHPDLEDRKIARGTCNFALAPAMTRQQAIAAIEAGMVCIAEAHARSPLQIVGLGEMGIGNTTAASAIISAATGIAPAAATGRGTGVDDAGLRHKAEVIARVIDFHRPRHDDGLDILCKVGGFEIAGIAGAALAAASKGIAVVLDGAISTAAGLIAVLLHPGTAGYLISGHRSVEVAQAAALEKMGLRPVIDLDLRLGEGTGAALTMDMVDAACRIMRDMASFDEAGVSRK